MYISEYFYIFNADIHIIIYIESKLSFQLFRVVDNAIKNEIFNDF